MTSSDWYYWKIFEEFRLKCTKFKQVDQLVRDNSFLTLVKGGHLCLKLSKMLYFGMYCLFLFIRSISWRSQKQAPTKIFSIVVTWAIALLSHHFESPWHASATTPYNRAAIYIYVQNQNISHDALIRETSLFHSIRFDARN